MSSIITLTFSPCIDKSTSIPQLAPEKKLRCTAPELDPGGGGINVARAIKKLGGTATAVFPAGGYTGKMFIHLMEQEDIPSVVIDCTQETRENFIVVDESDNNQYRFGMPGTALSEREWTECLDVIAGMEDTGFIVASGSLPPGVPMDVYARLAKIAHRNNAKLCVDTSGEALQHAITEGVYLLKPNMGELAALAGKEQISNREAEEIAKDLVTKYSCNIVVVSMGKDGAMMVTKDEVLTAKPPDVERKSTVGAGDSMVAGIVYSLANGSTLQHALYYGVACGTAATMHPGTELCNKDDADRLYELMMK